MSKPKIKVKQFIHVIQRTDDCHIVGRRALNAARLEGEIEFVSGDNTLEARFALHKLALALTLQLRAESGAATPTSRVDLTPEQVRETIEKAGVGDLFTAKVENVASRIALGRMAMFRMLENGTKRSRARASVGLLVQFAYEYEIIERPDDGSGVI